MNTSARIIILILVLTGVYFFTKDNNSSTTLPAETTTVKDNTSSDGTDTDEPLTPSAEGDASIILNEDQGNIDGTTLTKEVTLPQESATWTVSHTKSGFFPKTLTIKKGDTVRFVNNSDESMWVTSNPDTTLSDISEFDSKKSYESNSIFTYTFTKIGTWNYHNRENSSVEGTIIVK